MKVMLMPDLWGRRKRDAERSVLETRISFCTGGRNRF
jgi:hypothetical protein